MGRRDEDALFYLRTRGVGLVQARAMLVHAFAREILDAVEPEGQREELLGAVLARLECPRRSGRTFRPWTKRFTVGH